MLGMRITRGNFADLPRAFSQKLKSLVKLMLNISTHKRPSIYQILKEDIIQARIQTFLSQTVLNNEFSHTIFHKQHLIDKNGQINQLEMPSGNKPKLALESKKSEEKKAYPVRNFDPQIEKPRTPSGYNQRPSSSNNAPSNNYHYKAGGKGGGYQVGFNKPSSDIPKTKPKYTPPSISEDEQRRRREKENDREELRKQIEEREDKNKEAQKRLEKQRLDQWRKDYEEKQKKDYLRKQQEANANRIEMDRMKRQHSVEEEKRKQLEGAQRSNLFYQAKYEAEMNRRRHQEQESKSANDFFGYGEPDVPKKDRPSTAMDKKKNDVSGNLNSNQNPNYHYNKAYNREPMKSSKF
jgi:hypothetical protein